MVKLLHSLLCSESKIVDLEVCKFKKRAKKKRTAIQINLQNCLKLVNCDFN